MKHFTHLTPTTYMDLVTPWRPSGRGMEVFPELVEVEKEGLVPNQMHHKPWARRTLERDLSQSPNGRDAIWESILFLWRLEYLTSEWKNAKGGFRKHWQQYASEWLVSPFVAL
jgi:hypothetical protein